MGGIRVDSDTQMSRVPGLFAAGECAAGINGANRLGGNSLSDLLVFGKRAGEFAAKFAQENSLGEIDQTQIDETARVALAPFDRDIASGGSPYQVQKDLQELMQDNVGIVRREDEMRTALSRITALWQRAERVGVDGNREFNPGWHTALDLHNLLTVSEAVTRSALERKESRGAQFREDYPEKSAEFAQVNMIVSKGGDGAMQIRRDAIPAMREDLQQVIEEMK
jgi:succinate dehydrogenase / fumarate reductase flavoprotein subunit